MTSPPTNNSHPPIPTNQPTSPPHQAQQPPPTQATSPPSKRDLKSWWKGFKLPSKHQDTHGTTPSLLFPTKKAPSLSKTLIAALLLPIPSFHPHPTFWRRHPDQLGRRAAVWPAESPPRRCLESVKTNHSSTPAAMMRLSGTAAQKPKKLRSSEFKANVARTPISRHLRRPSSPEHNLCERRHLPHR